MAAIRAAAMVALLAPSAALATAGYFQLGYGLKAKGLGGAAVAFPQDALAAAANPAGMVWLGNRIDVGAEWFEADRGARIRGNALGLSGDRDANGRKSFLVPELGVNWMGGAAWSLGVSVYGNGGSTRYSENPLAALAGETPAGMEFAQAIAAPTLALKLGTSHSVGIALNVVYQQFTARGFQYFDDPAFSAAPGNVTNRGRDRSWGAGWRAGWLGRISPAIALGAAYQPRIRMGKFSRYRGLLAEGGNFDVPESYVVGAAWTLTQALTVAADVQRINFGGVPSLGKRADCFVFGVSCLLGAQQGPGAGWRNSTVYKLGIAWQAAPRLTLRGGLAHLRKPITASQTLLNMFSPAVTEDHLLLGATWQLAPGTELTVSYLHAFEGRLSGRGSMSPGFPPGAIGGGETDLRMNQRALGVAFGWSL